jgi:hypothetical protein
MTLQSERISLDLRPSGLQSTADLPQILPIWASNRRGSPSNLGPSEPRTSHTRKTTERPRSTRNTSEKLRNLGPLGSPLTQNASIASPKHIERPSYLESSQKYGKTPLRRLEQGRHGQSLCGTTRSSSRCLSTMGTLYPIVCSVENSTRSVR